MPWQDGEFITSSEDAPEGSYTSMDELDSQEQKAMNPSGRTYANQRDNDDEPHSKDALVGVVDQSSEEKTREVNVDKQIFNRVRNSTEIISMASVVAREISNLDYEFEYLGKSNGKRRKRDAETFWEQEAKGPQSPLFHALMDGLFTGEFYLWKNKMDAAQAQRQLEDEIGENYDFNYDKFKQIAARMSRKLIEEEDEGIYSVRGLRHVPTSTIEHDINKYGDVQSYVQSVGQKDDIELDPDKVLHYQFLKINGGTYAFPPLKAVFAELDMLANAKDFNGVYFNNAAIMNKIFKLKEDGPDSKNYKLLKNTVKKYRKHRNKYKDMVLTGDVEVENLNEAPNDMDFKELATYVTQVLAMVWQVPPSRAQMQIGGGSGARRSTFSNEGYFDNIRFHGNKLEALLNKELFEEEFNCRIKFKNPNTREEVRKADLELRRTEVANQRVALGVWSKEKAQDYLNVGDDETPDIEMSDEEFMINAGSINKAENMFLSGIEAEEDTADNQDRQQKQQSANSSPNQNDSGVQ